MLIKTRVFEDKRDENSTLFGKPGGLPGKPGTYAGRDFGKMHHFEPRKTEPYFLSRALASNMVPYLFRTTAIQTDALKQPEPPSTEREKRSQQRAEISLF